MWNIYPHLIQMLLRADIEENHAKQHQGEVEDFGLEILLMEESSTEKEADDDGATTYHADDGNHGIGQR